MLEYDGDLSEVEFLRYDVTAFGYWLGQSGLALVIGSGGGRDVLTALHAGFDDVTAVEINPDVIAMTHEVFPDFSGDPYSDPRVRWVAMDGRAPAVRKAATVLLDAPCTGTGVLRRRPDARWRVDPQRLRSLVELQRELLDAAAGVVRPGGLLVYSTCSLEAEENEEQVDDFLARHRDFEREPPDPLWVRGGSTDESGDLRVLPWLWDSDGAFASRLRRIVA